MRRQRPISSLPNPLLCSSLTQQPLQEPTDTDCRRQTPYLCQRQYQFPPESAVVFKLEHNNRFGNQRIGLSTPRRLPPTAVSVPSRIRCCVQATEQPIREPTDRTVDANAPLAANGSISSLPNPLLCSSETQQPIREPTDRAAGDKRRICANGQYQFPPESAVVFKRTEQRIQEGTDTAVDDSAPYCRQRSVSVPSRIGCCVTRTQQRMQEGTDTDCRRQCAALPPTAVSVPSRIRCCVPREHNSGCRNQRILTVDDNAPYCRQRSVSVPS